MCSWDVKPAVDSGACVHVVYECLLSWVLVSAGRSLSGARTLKHSPQPPPLLHLH